MNISINLPPEVLDDEEDFTPMTTLRQQSFNRLMEWRVFLRILHALCTAYGWTLEFDRSADGTDASCAIFANDACAGTPADAWQQAPLLTESLEQ